MRVVAFGHRKGVGKDTAGTFLVHWLRTELGVTAFKVGFADEVKRIAHRLYGWAGLQSGDYYELPENKHLKEIILPKLGKSPRQVWIELGTLVGREIYSHTWVDFLFYYQKCDYLVICDMRFLNETERVEQLGGYNICVENSRIPYVDDLADRPLLNYGKWHRKLLNEGNKTDLYNNTIAMMRDLWKI